MATSNPDGDAEHRRSSSATADGRRAPTTSTSRARRWPSPHAVGVAALIVSRYGHPDPQQGGIALNPVQTEKILMRTATPHACPIPPVLDYTNVGRPPSYTATCIPEANFGAGPGVASPNSIWGTGIVDALRAVTDRNG